MIKTIKIIALIALVSIFNTSCGGNDDGGGPPPTPVAPVVPNTAPTSVGQLNYPTADLLCIDNPVDFEWSASTDVDGDNVSYTLTIALDRDLNAIVEQLNVQTNSRTVTLQPGTAYYWNVIAKDNEDEASPSVTYAFYTEGEGESNYSPFTAALNAPALDASVAAGMTTLDWTGSDVDSGDTLTYDVYFGTTEDPALFQEDVTTMNLDVTTQAATTYYWSVDTTDDNGVKSIGQVWTFITN